MGYLIKYNEQISEETQIINFKNYEFDTIFMKKGNDSILEFWSREKAFFNMPENINEFIENNKNLKICFYGAGIFGSTIIEKIKKFDNVICVFDKDKKKTKCGEYPVLRPDKIKEINPDILILTLLEPLKVEIILSSKKIEEDLKYKIVSLDYLDKIKNTKIKLPQFIIDDWIKYNREIDFHTSPSESTLTHLKYIETAEKIEDFVDDSYKELVDLIFKKQYTHVFCIKSFERGGAEKIALNYMQVLTEINLSAKILCICTEYEKNIWINRVPKEVDIYNFGKHYSFLRFDKRVNFLFDIINNIKPKVLHVINSDLCYQMLKKYGLKVAEYSRIYDSQFCLNVSEEGFYTTFPTVYLKDHSHITAVFSENKNYLKDLKRIYNFPEDKFHCHYAPTPFHNIGYDNERLCMKIKNNEKLKILWAGRICTQKRPDILLKIAEKCKDLHVHFDIWGRFTDSYSQYDFSAENISYKGAFDGWTFSNKDYDLFIYTSMTDGMPNIILECLSGYMPVLTSNSGGVSEVIKHCETGFLVNEMDNIDEYVNIIKLILEKPQILEKIVLNGAEVIKTKFSWSKFINEVQKEREYTLIERLT